MKILQVSAVVCVSILVQGCVGTTVLKRGQPDDKGFRETPWLCDVPDRPKPISFEKREKLKERLEADYEKELPEIETRED